MSGESKIIGLGGQELESDAKKEEKLKQEEEAKKKIAEDLKKRQEEAQAAFEEQLQKIKDGRLDIEDPGVADIVSRLKTLKEVIDTNINIVRKEPQNVVNADGEKVRMNVPVASFSANIFDLYQMSDARTILLDRLLELAYKL